MKKGKKKMDEVKMVNMVKRGKERVEEREIVTTPILHSDRTEARGT